MEAKLHDYQKYAVDFIIEHPYCALLLDMGLGKTLSTLTAAKELIDLEMADSFLVIAPKPVAIETWPAEIAKWDHLKNLTYSVVLGTPKQRLDALKKKANFYIINRENVVWLVDYYKTAWPFKNVIIDELSSFKSPAAKRFKSLKRVRPKMDRVIGLTGTPAPNSLADLWSQVYLLDRGERLETTISRFRDQYCYTINMGHFNDYRIRDGADAAIYERIDDIAISMKAKDFLKLPKRTDNVVQINLGPKALKQYQQLERDLLLPLDESDITAANAAVLANKLLQAANGCIYDENKEAQEIHGEKLDALERITDEAQGQPVLIFYSYKHDRDRIKAKFKEARDLDVKAGDVERWNRGEIPVMLAHPQSAGHGLNLQYGGHIIVWFGLTWSLEYYQQANARLDRQGQTEPVIIHHLVAKDTYDERVMDVLSGKETNQNALMVALKAKLKELSAENGE